MYHTDVWGYWDIGDQQPGHLVVLAQCCWGHRRSFPALRAAADVPVRKSFMACEEGKTRRGSPKFEMAVGPRARDGGKPAYAFVC
jgi:hypothetical protein